jgi:prepilin-type N-terminal cleavage/methylation domain-containing protein
MTVMKTIADKFAGGLLPGNLATIPKPEFRNPKEARSPKPEIGAGRSGFGSSFDIRDSFGIRHSAFGILQVPSRRAFTLIELLTVIAIIGVIAGFVLMVAGPVKKKQYIYNTRAEMAQLETAIDRYKAAYGFYPPSPPIPPTVDNQLTLVNQLYYELEGTVYNPTNSPPTYTTLDGTPPVLTTNYVISAFGVGGFVNCTKPGAGEDTAAARNFLPDLKPKQIYNFTNPITGPQGVNLLIGSVGGPDAIYKPLGLQDVNPWRYNSSSPTNNPGSYDLWIQLAFGGKTNLICNWSKQVQINSPLP